MKSLPTVSLAHGNATAAVSLHGAHVLSWSVGGREQLFVSQRAYFEPPKAIRGGIPICFPQFGPRGTLPQHGFARNSLWRVHTSTGTAVVLELEDTEESRKVYPPFRAQLVVELLGDGSLQLSLSCEAKHEPMSFTAALHTYYAADVTVAAVAGLAGCVREKSGVVEDRSPLTIRGEVDEVFANVPRELRVATVPGRGVRLVTSPELADAVVWNPWIDKAAKMADFHPDEYRSMICVEVGVIAKPVVLQPGAKWSSRHTITAVEGEAAKL